MPNAEPGTYMVICATFLPAMLGPFELTVYLSHRSASVEQFWPPLWRISKSSGDKETASAGKSEKQDERNDAKSDEPGVSASLDGDGHAYRHSTEQNETNGFIMYEGKDIEA